MRHVRRSALLRDGDALEVVARYVLGVESYPFQLATNASILNAWQTPPLVMAGLWVPGKGFCIACGSPNFAT